MSDALNYLSLFGIAVLVAAIGAFPLGLVNLSVLKLASEKQINRSRQMAFGAALVEVLFSLTALVGTITFISKISGSLKFKILIAIVLLITAFTFFKKKKAKHNSTKTKFSGLLTGVFYNLISLQVFAYWIFAIAFLSGLTQIPQTLQSILVFVTAVFITKVLVLEFYVFIGSRAIKRTEKIEKNMNKIIGSVIFISAIVQIIKL